MLLFNIHLTKVIQMRKAMQMHAMLPLLLLSIFSICFAHRNRDFRLSQDLAMVHLEWMANWNCSIPRPQIVYPPSTSTKLYHPRGTILHRCNDQSGCCSHMLETCQPVASEQVEVIFFVTHVMPLTQRKLGQTSATEIRKMTNHTKCACKRRIDVGLEHDGLDVQEVVSKPIANNTSNVKYLFIIMVTLVVVILGISSSVYLYRRCQEAQRVIV